MSYIEKDLLPGEQIVYSGKLHWFIYVPAIFWLFAALAVYVVLRHNQMPPVISAVVALYAIFSLLRAMIASASTELAVTNKRIIYKEGLISRRTMELNHSKIESIREEQGIIDRLFDRGSLIIEGTGGGKEYLRNIDAPLTFKKHAQAAADQGGGAKVQS
jgi:uncharacterized membrane protein YdbT with pleckstrin-like domain